MYSLGVGKLQGKGPSLAELGEETVDVANKLKVFFSALGLGRQMGSF